MVLDIQNGTSVITDNGSGDSDLTPGIIVNSSTVAGFGITITVATSNSPGSPDGGLLQIQSLDIQNGNVLPASLTIGLSDTNFLIPGVNGSIMTLESSAGGTFTTVNGDTATFQSFADPNNAQPATAVSTPLQAYAKSGPNAQSSFSSTVLNNFVRNAGPYSLANFLTMNLSPGGQLNFSGSTVAYVPEPGTIGLSIVALGGLLARRRRA